MLYNFYNIIDIVGRVGRTMMYNSRFAFIIENNYLINLEGDTLIEFI